MVKQFWARTLILTGMLIRYDQGSLGVLKIGFLGVIIFFIILHVLPRRDLLNLYSLDLADLDSVNSLVHLVLTSPKHA